jgi:hypothetical protein
MMLKWSIVKAFVKPLSGFLLLCWAGGAARAQHTAYTDSVLVARNFPLLDRLQNNGELQALVQKNKVFRKEARAQGRRIKDALQHCRTAPCYAAGLQWTAPSVEAVGKELGKLYERQKAVRRLVADLRAQHAYALYDSLPDTALLRRAWRDAAAGINRIFDVYVEGAAPRYAKIDSISFNKSDTAFLRQVRTVVQHRLPGEGRPLFFETPLDAAMDVLDINGRDEAARYEPLHEGMNWDAFQKIGTTNFAVYPYSVILVPGLGPEDPAVVLDPQGARRCEEGVKRWRQGLAPFIVVSGGNVHPFKTPYNEAAEMKKYIVEVLKVPANAVFIEPHARHTTTNLRNTARMIYRFGLPANQPVLIVTDESQSSYITGRMEKTALRDLGYLPYQKLKKLSATETEFYPVRTTLHADPFDPLDP